MGSRSSARVGKGGFFEMVTSLKRREAACQAERWQPGSVLGREDLEVHRAKVGETPTL